MAGGTQGTRIAFLAAAFAVSGLTGIMATYVAPVPLEAAMRREAVLDEADVAARAPDATQRLQALRARLEDSAGAVLNGAGDPAARITAERARIRQAGETATEAAAVRLRLLIVVASIAAALFGAAMIGVPGGGRPRVS